MLLFLRGRGGYGGPGVVVVGGGGEVRGVFGCGGAARGRLLDGVGGAAPDGLLHWDFWWRVIPAE